MLVNPIWIDTKGGIWTWGAKNCFFGVNDLYEGDANILTPLYFEWQPVYF